MASVASESIVFPVDTALSERSRKFYDGTYQWDSEGFTDDTGGKNQHEMMILAFG